MELTHLRTFVEIAVAGNLTRASEKLYLSQAAVSAQLKGLEEVLGVRLFTRTSRGMVLSEEGGKLLPMARQVLDNATELRARADMLAGRELKRLVVGLNTDPDFLRMGKLIRVLSEKWPDADISFTPTSTADTPDRLRAGSIDLGFAFGADFGPDMSSEAVDMADVCVVAPAELFPDMPEPGWEDIAALPWIWTTCNCPFHAELMRMMAGHGVEPNRAADAVDEYIVRQYLLAGRGAAPLRRGPAEEMAEEGVIRIWEPGNFQVPLSLVRLNGPNVHPAVTVAVEELAAVWKSD